MLAISYRSIIIDALRPLILDFASLRPVPTRYTERLWAQVYVAYVHLEWIGECIALVWWFYPAPHIAVNEFILVHFIFDYQDQGLR